MTKVAAGLTAEGLPGTMRGLWLLALSNILIRFPERKRSVNSWFWPFVPGGWGSHIPKGIEGLPLQKGCPCAVLVPY